MYSFLKCLFVGVVIFLAGCATVSPEKLGISRDQWNQYTPEKREQLSANYLQTQKIQENQQIAEGSSVLQVHVDKGTALLPPFSHLQTYEPVSFELREGTCGYKIPVVSTVDANQKAMMTACYMDQMLYLDASPYEPDKALGSIQFRVMPVWKRGFTYPGVSSAGLVKFTGVDVFVKEVTP